MAKHDEEIMEVVMTLIMHGGDARSSALEAIAAARKNDAKRAQEKLDGAAQSIKIAHDIRQSYLLKKRQERM